MANAKRDPNRVTTLTALLETDGTTIMNLGAEPTTHTLMVDDNTTGSDNGPTPERALRDENYVTTIYAVSSADGETPVALYANADGELLIDHT